MDWIQARRTSNMNPSIIREILKITSKPGIVSFAGGWPSPETFPVEEFEESCAAVLREGGGAALQYSTSEGFEPLRELIAASLPWEVSPANVLITTGSQQGLALLAQVLIDEGSRVLVETPTYLGALQAFAPMEPAIVGVDSDAEGIDVRDFTRKSAGARFLYALPNFQNPTGRTMSGLRRRELVAAADEVSVPIVEDDPYRDLWFESPPPEPLCARNPGGCVYLGSFSKILAPGLRVGYLVAPQQVFQKVLYAKQAIDLHTSSFNQRVVARLMGNGFLERHVPSIREFYRKKRDVMLAALSREMADMDVSWNEPDGGMFLWFRLRNGLKAYDLLPHAVNNGVAYVAGEPFYAGKADPATLRLSFATASVEQIEQGIAALANTIRTRQNF
ncbi:aminotransferase-like domain-containing protein [Paraburkholderia unamae]|uniref:aminotransferase-like domain-containing protein n=1 Tax=Paraburkholderia unamae TaxID=219649 RepID=UPI001CC4013C|nr:PLP-dependent aminotransferase family protein [Paraburkholderia unamae]